MKVAFQSRFKMDPVPIRGHTLLCLQGFRGEGYDPMFTAHMSAIHRRLTQDPHILVQVMTSPDTFCHSCPNLSAENSCRLHGDGTEVTMVEQDKEVMRRLGLKSGDILSWETILKKISATVRPEMLNEICGECPWLPLNYCKEGLIFREEASLSSPAQTEE
ncbi:MAG: DUF1284 domain-containing protein [Nitrospirae bacterium]|nr:DUF1284 domain-containing protein [Nitrospirota bacterium]MBI3352573.1 DUF1284 domain-containing protein [Nitrospirota bacterium]